MPHRKQSCLRSNMLTILTVIGVVGGSVVGCIIRTTHTKFTDRQVMYVQFLGDLFLRMLKLLIVPLLVSSVICAIGSLDLSLSKKIAVRSMIFYLTTTICATTLGIILVTTIRPGIGIEKTEHKGTAKGRPVLTQDTLMDLVRNVFPENLVRACIETSQTELSFPEELANLTEAEKKQVPLEQYTFTERYEQTTNVLGLVTFSVIFGASIGKMGKRGKPLLIFFETLSEAMMNITSWVIWLSPVGVFFLVTAKVLAIDSFAALVGKLGLYFATVMLGLALHGFGTLSVIYLICTRKLPFKVISELGQVLSTAFGTASSSATMPVTIQTLDRIGLDPRVIRFVIPVGATINMDGTALYEAVAAIFIAQLEGMELSFGKIVAVCATATMSSIGAAGIPQAALVTMVMVLETVGLSERHIINIIAVDWLLDRFRTTINVMCDCLGASLVNILSTDELSARPTELDRVKAEKHELLEMTKTDNCT